MRRKLATDLPEVSTFFQTGGLVDSIVNQGMPAPIDIQVTGNDQHAAYDVASEMAQKLRRLPDVSDVLIPQDLDYPGIQLNVNRELAARMGLTASGVVENVITALTSNGMIAPGYWIDPRSGNNYFLTVQYAPRQIQDMTMEDFKQIPLHAKNNANPTVLENVADVKMINTPTEVDHYQLFRIIDVYVSPRGEDLGTLLKKVQHVIGDTKLPPNTRVQLRGSVVAMNDSFKSFAIGLSLSVVLVYLILMAQFASFSDPFIILLAVPPGFTGVILFLLITHTSINIMSLMGVMMMIGIVVSDSILIVEFTRELRRRGEGLNEAIQNACHVRLRPIMMTTFATLLGLIPLALALEAGSEQYAPLARAIIGGLMLSFIVDAVPGRRGLSADAPKRRTPAARGEGMKLLKITTVSFTGAAVCAYEKSTCMSSFAIKYPFFILMLCLGIVVVGVTTVARMPVDLFPQIQIPVVVVATFYSGMPPQQIEADITDTFERFFTLGSNIDHIESRSLTGVSLIKVYFQPGTDPDAAVSEIANLAMADLRRLPQGTLPPWC